MDFYDDLSPLYHLIFPDWDESMRHQGAQLHSVIQAAWPECRKVLDVSCGIGTQALALATRGYVVTGSDVSGRAIERARREAGLRGLDVAFSVADMRAASVVHGTGFDLVISCDNAMPHLLTDEDLLLALRSMRECLRPGGGCLVSVRDYAQEDRTPDRVRHYAARAEGGKRYVPFQIRDFQGEHYDLGFFVVEEDLATGEVRTHVMRSRYYAIPIERLCGLMREAGFVDVWRIDGAFYQPLLAGSRSGQD